MVRKKRKFSLRKLIYNDKYLIVCSILLAIIIWIATSMNLSPETTKRITVPVTIDFSDTLAGQLGIQYFGNKEITVDVRVTCKKYLAKDIDDDDITAALQVNTVTSTGYHSVPILVTASENADFVIEGYFPTSAEGYYDIPSSKRMNVEINYKNEDFIEEGFVLGTTTLSESVVNVSGPKTYIDNISRVVGDVEFDGKQSEPQVVTLTPRAIDANGNTVSYVTITNNSDEPITATIPILKVQTLPTLVNIINVPENAADSIKIKYSVPKIKVGVLKSSKLESAVIGEVDYKKLKSGDNNFTFNASVVNGFTVLDNTTNVEVTITLN